MYLIFDITWNVLKLKSIKIYSTQLMKCSIDILVCFLYQVKLMKQVKEEAERSKQSEARRNREMGQMKREQLKKENRIKNLEREKQQKELILRRKQEEVITLLFSFI